MPAENFAHIFKKVQASRAPLHLCGVGDCHHWELTGNLHGMGLEVYFRSDVGDLHMVRDQQVGGLLFSMHGGPKSETPCTIVTEPLSKIPNFSAHKKYFAPIKYILYGASIDCVEDFATIDGGIKSVLVETPIVARTPPGVTLPNEPGGRWLDALTAGSEFSAQAQHNHPLVHREWRCEYISVIGTGGIAFNNMQAVLPVEPYKHEGSILLDLAKVRTDAWRTLLTILQGGGRVVPIVSTALRLQDGLFDSLDQSLLSSFEQSGISSSHPFVSLLFPLRQFHCVDRLPSEANIWWGRSALTKMDALDRIGMQGVEQWCRWHSDFRHQEVIDYWLYNDELLGSLSSLEGIGRCLLKDQGHTGPVHFTKSVKAVLQEIGVDHDFGDRNVLNDLDQIHIKLVKHIGDSNQNDLKKYRQQVHAASMFSSLLVGIALLKIGTKTQDAQIQDSWLSVMRAAYDQINGRVPVEHHAVKSTEIYKTIRFYRKFNELMDNTLLTYEEHDIQRNTDMHPLDGMARLYQRRFSRLCLSAFNLLQEDAIGSSVGVAALLRPALESFSVWLHLLLAKDCFSNDYADIEQVWSGIGCEPSDSDVGRWQKQTEHAKIISALRRIGTSKLNDAGDQYGFLDAPRVLLQNWTNENSKRFHGMVHGDLHALHREYLAHDGGNGNQSPYAAGELANMARMLMQLVFCLGMKEFTDAGSDLLAAASTDTEKSNAKQKFDKDRGHLIALYRRWENSIQEA